MARKSIDLDYMAHGAPIPMGSRIGNTVLSSAIGGYSQSLGKTPEDPEGQAKAIFENVANFMKAAGGGPEHIIKMVVLFKEGTSLAPINEEWLKMFPDEHSRPARHAENPNRLAQGFYAVEVTAVIE
jgi:2-iminobutanoate/2-iminopropanoate deaminase